MSNGKIDHRSFYRNVFDKWQTKLLGPMPTAQQLAIAHALRVRGPGLEALAGVACMLREQGITRGQQRLISGLYRPGSTGTHINCVFGPGGYIEQGLMTDARDNAGVYRAKLTAKGEAVVARFADTASPKVERMVERSAAARKAKGKGKGKRNGAAKGEAPVEATPAPVATPEATEQPQA